MIKSILRISFLFEKKYFYFIFLYKFSNKLININSENNKNIMTRNGHFECLYFFKHHAIKFSYQSALYLHLVTTNKVKRLMNKNQQSKKIKKEEKLLIQLFNMCYVILR